MAKISLDLKYQLYEGTVQNHETDIEFINEQFHETYNRYPLSLREDFGGTGAMACDWVKQSKEHKAWAIDLDTEPMDYGKKTHFVKLNADEQKRMSYILGNVLAPRDEKSDVIVAFNFSYFIFKNRKTLVEYFKMVHAGLEKSGMFFLDIFGGLEARQALVEETKHEKHTYYWDCDKYNPITEEVLYYIHFKTHHDKVKYEKVFTYDWRQWSIGEIRDALYDAGFSDVITYWEGTDEDGSGDGEFYRAYDEENCESWVTYLSAIP